MMGLFRRSPDPARLAARLPEGPLRDLVGTPAPEPSTPASELRLLAVDVETTGLDPDRDSLLSIGWVPVDGDRVVLAGAGHRVLRQDGNRPFGGVGQSATFHGITDDQLAAGVAPETALGELCRALQGRVLLAHHAVIETGFLQRAMRRAWGAVAALSSVDTLQLQYRLLSRGFDDEPAPGALRLWGAREHFGLPWYQAHEALTDALACAELYLAQVSELGWNTPLRKLR